MARRSISLLVGGALLAAGCVATKAPPPPRPTQVCGVGFGNPVSYQGAFYALGQGNTGWVTADGFVPVQLPDGRTVWWMSDTTTGTANPDNTVSDRGNVHNSIVEQGASCLTPHLGAIPQSGGTWYWPGSAVVNGNGTQLLVFSYRVTSGCGSGAFDFCVNGTAFTRYALPSLQLLEGPTIMPLNSAPNGGDAVPWGIRSVLSSDGNLYLYGTTKYSIGPFGTAADAWVGRAPFNNPQQLEYFTNPIAVTPATPAWSTNFADARPMTFTKNSLPDNSPLAQLSVVQDGSRYLATAFAADVFQDNQGRSFVWAWEATSPEGPWNVVTDGTNPRNIAVFQKRSANQFAYDARTVPLPGAAWTVVYSANDPQGQLSDFTLYRGEFASPNGFPP